MSFCPNNIDVWFCYAEADFHEHGVTDSCAQFLVVVKELLRDFNRSTSDVSKSYGSFEI